MIAISYSSIFLSISILWIMVRGFRCLRSKNFSLARELQLLLAYICIVVVVRFTFFPFGKVDGQIQPLIFDAAQMLPFRINLVPIVYLLDYEVFREAILNFIGNFTMFIPLGIVWPICFRKLNTHGKTIAAGVGTSLVIEILQLPFFQRVSDIDDLLLNSLGYLAGYGLYLLVRKLAGRKSHKSA